MPFVNHTKKIPECSSLITAHIRESYILSSHNPGEDLFCDHHQNIIASLNEFCHLVR